MNLYASPPFLRKNERMEADSSNGMEWDYPLHAFFDERRADMSNAFEEMNMEVCMEETPFEEAGDTGKGENGLPDGFMDSTDAFEENPFDSGGQEPDAASLPAQEETVSDGAWEDAEESDDPETDGTEETRKSEKERAESSDAEEQSEDKKRAVHEAAEARRKAEWEARQQAKKDAEKAQMERIMAMSEAELMSESMKRVGTDTEKLTRRNMKECVSEHIQSVCSKDPAFARKTLYPHKSIIHCFHYINRMAKDYLQQEMKDNDIKPENGVYGGDVPDDLVYQWSIDYFNDPDAQEDHVEEEKFTPRPYVNAASKAKGTTKPKKAAKKVTEKKQEPKKNDYQQMSLPGVS